MQISSTGSLHEKPSVLERLERLTGSKGNPVSAVAIAVLAAWALVNWTLTLRRIVLDYNPLPVWDYWQTAEHLQRYKAFDLSVFWVQHNEHRIVFPESIFALDMLLFGGHQIFSLVVSFACYLGVLVVLAWSLRSDHTIPPNVRNAAVLLAGIIIGWEGSSVVVGNTFLLQWTMLQFAVALALALLAKSLQWRSLAALIASVACGVIATFSSGNGMLLWPVLLAAAIILRLPKLRILLLAAAAVASVWLFFIGYHSPAQMQLLAIFKHPVYFICFLAAYVSMPLGAFGQPQVGVLFGLCNLAAWLFLLAVAFRKRLLSTTPAIVFFGSCVFLIASGVLTAAGRMNPADPAYIAARAARYVSLPLVNWGVLILALVWISARAKWELLSVTTIIVLAALLALGMTSALYPWITGNGSFIADQQVASLAVENGVFDPDFDGKLYSDPNFVPKWLPVLQTNRLAIFSGYPEMSWLGRDSRKVFEPCATPQPGSAVSVYPVEGGFEVTGRALLDGNSKVVFSNQRNVIVGFGEETKAGVPAVLADEPGGAGKEWVGFINSGYGSTSFTTSVVSHGALCPLAGPRPLATSRKITATGAGAPIPGVTWSGAGWRENALPPASTDTDPLVKNLWSSWNGSDTSTGSIASSSIAVPANGCLVLPVLHGPVTGGLKLQLVDAGTERVLQSLPLRGGESGWRLWRIRLDRQPAAVRIRAIDAGAGWGEWFAVGSPLECR